MKVGVLGRYRTTSANGVDRTVSGHLGQLQRKGHEVTLLATEEVVPEASLKLEEIGVAVSLLPRSLPARARALWRLRGSFDLLWLHSVFSPGNWLAFLLVGGRWLVTPNGGYSGGSLESRRPLIKRLALWLVERRMLEGALAIHVLSAVEARQVSAVAPGAATVIAPNGFEFGDGEAVLSQRPVRPPTRLLFIGRLAWRHKGLDRLIKALDSLEGEAAWHLDLVGPDDAEAVGFLTGLMTKEKTRQRVSFRGASYGEEKDAYLADCHLFIHTSRWEGMPFAVVEALAAGKPVLLTAGTNMTEMVERWDAGWVATDDGIAAVLREILRCPDEELVRRGARARELVDEELRWDRVGDRLIEQVERRWADDLTR